MPAAGFRLAGLGSLVSNAKSFAWPFEDSRMPGCRSERIGFDRFCRDASA
jgi:hypothetical protein